MNKKIEVTLWDILGSEQHKKEYGFRSMTSFIKPKNVDWVSPQEAQKEIAVFTDGDIVAKVHINFAHMGRTGGGPDISSSKYKIGWIVECRSVHLGVYEELERNRDLENKFDYIFTSDEQLLRKNPNKYVLNHIGTSRIVDKHSKLYKKTKLVSLIASTKRILEGHILRHEIGHWLTNNRELPQVDLWGSGFGYDRKMPQRGKVLGLAEYAYSIAIENSKHKNYFTEKIIDCFRTGTIPIYWGCDEVDDYFDPNGIIKFDNIAHLEEILQNLSFDDYNSRIESVRNNYELAKEWVSMDDRFINNLKEVLKK